MTRYETNTTGTTARSPWLIMPWGVVTIRPLFYSTPNVSDRRACSLAEISPPIIRTGVPVQLPLNRFHLRDHRFPDQAVPGRLPWVEQLRLPWHLDFYHQGQSFD